jgi:glucokinase
MPRMAPSYVLAADIGGTKTATAVVSSAGEILQISKAPTDMGGPPALINQIATMLQDDLRQAGVNIADVLGLGVGIAAAIDTACRVVVWAPNLPGWENVPLYNELVARLNLPVRIEYDGHAAVLGEWWLGAGKGYRNVIFVIVGTGIGGGMILDGQLYRGASQLAGAAGWFVLGTQRVSDEYAQRLGHWESLAAGPGVDRFAAEKLRQSGEPSILREQSSGSYEKLTTQMIFNAARKGDTLACDAVRHVGEILGVGIANIVSLMNPEVVIVGGGVGTQADLLIDQIREVVLYNAQPVAAQAVQIVPAELGANAGLLGAAQAVMLHQGNCGEQ